MDARVEREVRTHESPEPGVVAASVYTSGQCIADISIDEAGKWSKKPGHVVWIGLFEPSYELLSRIEAQLGLHYLAIEDAGKAHQHPEDRAVRRRPVHRRAHRADAAGADCLRRDAPVRRARLCGLGAAWSINVVCPCAEAVRSLPHDAVARRRLHPLCHPRFHRRQLHAGTGDGPSRGRGDGGTGVRGAASDRGSATPLRLAARAAAAAQCRRAPRRGLPATGARRGEADRPGDAAAVSRRERPRQPQSRRRSTRCARYWRSRSKQA